MRKITAKSLFQETWEVDVPPAASISDVLAQLAAADPRLTNVSLLLHGRRLKRSQQVAELSIDNGAFLTVIIKKAKTAPLATRAVPAQPSSRECVAAAAADRHHHHEVEAHPPDVLDTLIEGYNCRPGPSPLKAQRSRTTREDAFGQQRSPASAPARQIFEKPPGQAVDEAGWVGDADEQRQQEPMHADGAGGPEDDKSGATRGDSNSAAAMERDRAPEAEAALLFAELQGELTAAQGSCGAASTMPAGDAGSMAVEALLAADNAHQEAPLAVRRSRAGRHGKARAAGSSSVVDLRVWEQPLPEPLERLQAVFEALNAIHGFLQAQNIQATWSNVQDAVQELLRQRPDCLEPRISDVEAMAQLAPSVVTTRACGASSDGGDAPGAPSPLSPTCARCLRIPSQPRG